MSSATYPRAAAALTEDVAKDCAREYLNTIEAFEPTALRVTDKLPTNFAHLGLAATLLPGARVIHCTREPMALCLSIYEQQFGEGHHWAYDFDDIAFFYRNYRALLAHWRQVLPLPMLEIAYEDLVENQAAGSRQLVEFCGLEWDERCLDFHQVERKVESASNWQVRQPMYRTSLSKWKRYGQHLAPLRTALADLVPAAG